MLMGCDHSGGASSTTAIELAEAQAQVARCQQEAVAREEQLAHERRVTTTLSFVAAVFGAGCLLFFGLGALAGSKARNDSEACG